MYTFVINIQTNLNAVLSLPLVGDDRLEIERPLVHQVNLLMTVLFLPIDIRGSSSIVTIINPIRIPGAS